MAAEAAKTAQVGRLFLTHFAAHLYDTKGKRMQAQAAARRIFPNTMAAMDGMRVKI